MLQLKAVTRERDQVGFLMSFFEFVDFSQVRQQVEDLRVQERTQDLGHENLADNIDNVFLRVV